MPIFTMLNPKGGAGKSTCSLQIIKPLKADLVIDIDDQMTITQFNKVRVSLGQKPFPVEAPRTKQAFKELIKANQDKTILIDSIGVDSDYTRQILAVADVVLTPVDDEPASILGLQRLASIRRQVIENLEKNGLEAEIPIYTFYNRAHSSRKNFEEIDAICKKLGYTPLKTRIIRHHSIAYSASSGQTVQESAKDQNHRAVTGFRDLAKEAKRKLK